MPTPTHFLSKQLLIGLALTLLGLGTSNCHKEEATMPTPAPTIKLGASAKLGNYLTDAQGNTLYLLASDIDGTNTCTGGCQPMWPVFYEANIQVPATLQASDFGSRTTPDGRQQTTYKGWPLYRYAPTTNGQNVLEAAGATGGSGIGGIWHVAKPDYSVLLAQKTIIDKKTSQSVSKTFLVDAKGRTLYYFAKDNSSPGTQPSNCTGGCATVWPALYLSAAVAPSTLAATDFGTITRDPSTTTTTPDPYGYGTTSGSSGGTSSTLQLTYKGHPLYYYAADNATRGTVEGHDLNSSGDYWYVAAP